MLSERDRRTLAEIERDLCASDPGLARRFESAGARSASRPPRAGWTAAGSADGTAGGRRTSCSPRIRPYALAVLGPLALVTVSALVIAPVLVPLFVCCTICALTVRTLQRWDAQPGSTEAAEDE
jgi:hypothetical protein